MLKKIKKTNYHTKIILIIALFSLWEIFYLTGFYQAKSDTLFTYRYQPQEYTLMFSPKWQKNCLTLAKSFFHRKVFFLSRTIKLNIPKRKSLSSFVYPFKLPLRDKFYLSSPYGYRYHPILHRRLFHKGVDLACKRGTSIYPISPGGVVFSGWRGQYGRLVIVNHQNGYKSYYAHCSRLLVKAGDKVSYTTILARVGRSGLASGNHLHLEIHYKEKCINPARFFDFKRHKNRKLAYLIK